MEVETKKVSRFGKKFWLKVAVGFIIFSIIYGMGNSSAKVDLGKDKVNYDELIKVIKSNQKEVVSTEKKLDDIQKQYSEKESEFNEAKKVVDNKKSVEDEIVELTKQTESKKGEIAELDKQIKTKNDELAAVTGQIKEKVEEPKVLSAGFFTVGKDIPAGRYKVVPNGGSGNFFVNGGLNVNIMLGKGEFYEEEYVFQANDGDEIELTLSAKFIPVE